MFLRFFIFAVIFFLISCTEFERGNPDDPGSENYIGNRFTSSSGGSSSGGVSPPLPSSSGASSSSVVPSSSSRASSSSVVSSSSSKPSSSSITVSSSSSVPVQPGVVYGPSVTYEGETYETVVIGTQTWFKRNLNYNASGSKCYNDDPANCDKYGKLYYWATAMDLPSSCNSSTCGSQVQTKHKGICPSGWHIPSDGDWDNLMTAVGGSSTAGKKLKATSGWNSSGNGTDDYGFAALPGGNGGSDGDFGTVGDLGGWWSASEYDSDRAYNRYMDYNIEDARWGYDGKNYLFSVRCLQD